MSAELLNYPQPSQNRGIFARLLRYMLPHRGKVALSLTILLVATATDVFQPILIKIFIDQYLIPHHFPENVMVALSVGYMGLVVTTSGLNVFQLLLFQMLALEIIQTLLVL